MAKKSHAPTPVFIGGTGRSGTTVLGDLLNAHSQIRTSVPTEIKFFANRGGFLDLVFGSMESNQEDREPVSILHYRTYRQRKLTAQAQREKRFTELEAKIWDKWWKIDAVAPHGPGLHAGIDREVFANLLGKHKKKLIKNPVPAAQSFLDDFIASQSDHKGEKFWAETTPMNISYAHRLIKVKPTALFIVMKRDPRDVIASLLKKDWGPTTALEGVEWIENRLKADHAALQSVPKDQQLTIHLEDLVTNKPQESYGKILDFLGIKDEPAMREFHQSNMTADNASTGRWKSEIASPEFEAAIAAMEVRLGSVNSQRYLWIESSLQFRLSTVLFAWPVDLFFGNWK